MRKIIISIVLILAIGLLASCSLYGRITGGSENDGGNGVNNGSEDNGNGGNDNGGNGGEQGNRESVKMTATVKNISDKIEVEVIEGEYGASGIYWVITYDETAFAGKDGEKITRADLKVGDTVEILYGGQVMMSYPPQIVAGRITVL